MEVKQKFTDARRARSDYSPGDRLVIRLPQPIPVQQMLKIEKKVEKYCGCSVRLLFVDCANTKVYHCTPDRAIELTITNSLSPNINQMKIGLIKVELNEGDKIAVVPKFTPPSHYRKFYDEMLSRWIDGVCEYLWVDSVDDNC